MAMALLAATAYCDQRGPLRKARTFSSFKTGGNRAPSPQRIEAL